jgi:hypothetical protein
LIPYASSLSVHQNTTSVKTTQIPVWPFGSTQAAIRVGYWLVTTTGSRERTKKLAKHLEAAAELLKNELDRSPSPEARMRIERLLAKQATDPEKVRTEKARQVLVEIDRLRLGDAL